MKVKLGKGYNKVARGVFAVSLREDFDVVTAFDDEDETVSKTIMDAAGLTAAVCALKDDGWSLDAILMTASDAYKNGWC